MIDAKQGTNIRKLRDKLNLTQDEFADLIGVAVFTVSRWERGKSRPRPIHRKKMERLEKKNKK